jgi:hypothetical protein
MPQLPKLPVPQSVERALDGALDKALEIQRPVVTGYLERLRAKHPTASPAELIEQLERRYVATVISTGAASGGAAALPGFGTSASLAAGAAEIAAFVGATALYVLAVAEVHGVPLADPQVRRALVLTVLLGEIAEPAVEAAAGGATHWAHVLGRGNRETIGGVNARLAQHVVGRFGTRQGALLIGRAIPFGIGAGIGAAGNAALARSSIGTARRAFGPAPKRFTARIVEGSSSASALSTLPGSLPKTVPTTRSAALPTTLRKVYGRARPGRKAP